MGARAGFFVGDVAPTAVTLMVGSGGPPSDLDLTTVSAATIQALRPDGAVLSWTATLSGATPTSLTLTYVLASGDLAVAGDWIVYALLTVPGGTKRTDPTHMPVFSKFARP